MALVAVRRGASGNRSGSRRICKRIGVGTMCWIGNDRGFIFFFSPAWGRRRWQRIHPKSRPQARRIWAAHGSQHSFAVGAGFQAWLCKKPLPVTFARAWDTAWLISCPKAARPPVLAKFQLAGGKRNAAAPRNGFRARRQPLSGFHKAERRINHAPKDDSIRRGVRRGRSTLCPSISGVGAAVGLPAGIHRRCICQRRRACTFACGVTCGFFLICPA